MGFPLLDILNIGTKIIERVIPDPAAKLAATQKLAELQQAGELADMAHELALVQTQTDINKVEAASTNWWTSGWRPYIGWVCGTGLLINSILRPLLMWASSGFKPEAFPVLDVAPLMTLLTGMLGLAGLRTYEKTQNVQGQH